MVKGLRAKFPRFYTEVSYTLFNTLAADGVRAATKADLSGRRGSGYCSERLFFMTLQEKEELALYTDFLAEPGSEGLWEKLTGLNMKVFLSSKFYAAP